MLPYRNNNHDLNYYGSDLNKFIDEHCTRKMTAINIDLLTFKRSNNHMRVIESKHENEHIPPSQMEALRILDGARINGIKFEVFIVTGNPPYETATIERINNGAGVRVSREQLIRFLDYECEYTDLAPLQFQLC